MNPDDPESFVNWLELGVQLVSAGGKAYKLAKSPAAKTLYQKALDTFGRGHIPSPLDWNVDWGHYYSRENDVLWLRDDKGREVFYPQKLVLDGRHVQSDADILIVADPSVFRPAQTEPEALEFYRAEKERTKARFFNGENARLVEVSPTKWVFQRVGYFDYLTTNLALDGLRKQKLRGLDIDKGCLRPLANSCYANSTGINSLVFTSDGYAVFMVRNGQVLVRPGEICSGYSGTIDYPDVKEAETNPRFNLKGVEIDREGQEECAFWGTEVTKRRLLGVTRELVRGGTPEVFYAVELDIKWEDLKGRTPADKEGSLFAVNFTPKFAKCYPDGELVDRVDDLLWHWMHDLVTGAQRTLKARNTPAVVSVPLFTNIALWLLCAGCKNVGAAPFHNGA
jgi:hypothetical protein